jgi:hypothetical protein
MDTITNVSYTETKKKIISHHIFPIDSEKKTIRTEQRNYKRKVFDLRKYKNFNLDKNGFCIDKSHYGDGDLFDDKFVKRKYFPLMAKYLKSKLNAKKVIIFDYNQRSFNTDINRKNNHRTPVLYSHVDYTIDSGLKRTKEILRDNKITFNQKHRYSLINIWRPIKKIIDYPLALCDGKTVSMKDLVQTNIHHYGSENLNIPHHSGKIYSLINNRNHKWYFLSKMDPKELFIIKNWDSKFKKFDDHVLNAPHSAIKLPGKNKSRTRQSIEIRTLVIRD